MRKVYWLLVALALVLCMAATASGSSTQPLNASEDNGAVSSLVALSGYVYEGECGIIEPPVSTPLQNVTVNLYGSNDQSSVGTLLNSATTNSQGFYSLTVPETRIFEYYNIIETNPQNYVDVCARSIGGTPQNNNWIQYEYPLTGKTLTGNNFWDRTRVPRTSTPTSTATRPWTATSTITRPPTVTSTITRPPTVTATRPTPYTPTPTGTVTRPPTVTATPTRPLTATSTATRPTPYTPTKTATPTNTRPPYPPPLTPTATPTPACRPNPHVDKGLLGLPGGTVEVGNMVTYAITVTNASDDAALDFTLVDHFPADYLEFVSAAPPPDSVTTVNMGGVLTTYANWFNEGPLPPHSSQVFLLRLRAKMPTGQTPAINVAEVVMEYLCGPAGAIDRVPVVIAQPEGPLRVTKTLVYPPNGVAQVGDLVRFQILVANASNSAVFFDIEDHFLDAEFDFVSATPPPTVNVSDGTNHLLKWENLTLPPGGSLTIEVVLRAKLAGVVAQNCARFTTQAITGAAGLVGPFSCAQVRILPREGGDIEVRKWFYDPANHMAMVGDMLEWRAVLINTGSLAITNHTLHDFMTPASCVPPGDWLMDFTSAGPLPPGSYYLYTSGAWPAADICTPAINTAVWTVEFSDGSKMTKAAQDYVYILDKPQDEFLRVRKERILPSGNAVISDTVTFRLTIYNVSNAPIAVVPLQDTFETACLSFQSATVPITSQTADPGTGKTTLFWANVGPIPAGGHISIDVSFHADAVCIDTLNCMRVERPVPFGPSVVAMDCAPVTIQGRRPELRLVKHRLTNSPVPVGGIVEYSIHVHNGGDAPANPVPLTDRFDPAFLEFTGASVPPDVVDNANGLVRWANIGPIPPGGDVSILIRLRAKQPGVGIRNCAYASYPLGDILIQVYDCAFVDIFAPSGIAIEKRRIQPPPNTSAAVGDAVVYEVIVRNVGQVPLFNVRVTDHYDPQCLFAVPGQPGLIYLPPAEVAWDIPTLPPGGVDVRQLLFIALAPCGETINCAHVVAFTQEGTVVIADSCAPVTIREGQPGLEVDKRVAAPLGMPQIGDIIKFEIVVRNTGNITLVHVPVDDHFNESPKSLEFVSALPAPDSVNPTAGDLHWNNLGPIPPNDIRVITLFMRAVGPRSPVENCVYVIARDASGRIVEARDCVLVHLSTGLHRIYLPLILRQYPRPPYPAPRSQGH